MGINSDKVVDKAVDNLTRMVQVIRADRALREWFFDLAGKAAVDRRNEIFLLAGQMQAAEEDADLVASFRLLADPPVFDATCAALRAEKSGA